MSRSVMTFLVKLPVYRLPATIFATVAGCLLTSAARADDWPQWLGPKRDGVWRETGILETFPSGGPRVRWRTPIGAGYAGPSVVAGRVYVTDRILPDGAKAAGRRAISGKERV